MKRIQQARKPEPGPTMAERLRLARAPFCPSPNGYDAPARLRAGDVVRLQEGPALVENVNDCNARVRFPTPVEKRFVERFGWRVLLRSEGELERISRNSELDILYRRTKTNERQH